MEAVDATGAALVLEDGRSPPQAHPAVSCLLAAAWMCQPHRPARLRLAPHALHADERALLAAIAHHAPSRSRRPRGHARRPRPKRSMHRVKNNCADAGVAALRLQARSADADLRKALEDSVNRILAIAAVHEVLTEQREEVVELRELIDRLPCDTLVQGARSRKQVHVGPAGEVPLSGEPLDGRWRSFFSELAKNALEHGGMFAAEYRSSCSGTARCCPPIARRRRRDPTATRRERGSSPRARWPR